MLIKYSYPVKEVESLRGETVYSEENLTVTPSDSNVLEGIEITFAVKVTLLSEKGVKSSSTLR